MSHARLSPSAAHRWARCAYAPLAEAGIPSADTAASVQGTCAHELAELCAPNNLDPTEYINQKIAGYVVDEEMALHVQTYIDYIYSIGITSATRYYELPVRYDHVVPNGHGTCDCVIVTDDTLHIVDLKYGKGELVEARENYQLLLYAIGALAHFVGYQFQYVSMHIYQPRLNNTSKWTQQISDFVMWREFFANRAMATYDESPPANPSPKACRWCKAKGECAALADYLNTKTSFKGLSKEDRTLSLERCAEIYNTAKLIIGFLESVGGRLQSALMTGQATPGVKLVKKKTVRRFDEEPLLIEALEAELGDQAYETKLVSPAKAEKIMGKKRFKAQGFTSYIKESPTELTIAPEDDRRKAVKIEIEGGTFTNVNRED